MAVVQDVAPSAHCMGRGRDLVDEGDSQPSASRRQTDLTHADEEQQGGNDVPSIQEPYEVTDHGMALAPTKMPIPISSEIACAAEYRVQRLGARYQEEQFEAPVLEAKRYQAEQFEAPVLESMVGQVPERGEPRLNLRAFLCCCCWWCC